MWCARRSRGSDTCSTSSWTRRRSADISARPATSVREIGWLVYLPSLLYAIGQGAVAPAVALSALDLGATPAVAGLLVAGAGLGQIVGTIPAGWLVDRVGERLAMMLASAFVVLALLLCIIAPSTLLLAAGVAATGLSAAVFALARQAYVTDVAAPQIRARALSTLGGVMRIGMFMGPFVGAAVISWTGTDGAYAVHLLMGVLTVLVLLRLPDVRSPGRARVAAMTVIRDHARIFRTLGTAVCLIGALRASRQVVIPLWANHLGLDAATTSLVFGISGAVDMLLFYPAGYVMDRWGRAFAAVPSMLVLAVAHLALPFSASVASLTAVAIALGIGNGLGSGIIMTLAADVSPTEGRGAFFAVWRLCADTGNGVGPLLLSAVTAAATLGTAIVVMGGAGVGAAMLVARYTRPRALETVGETPSDSGA